MKLDDDDFALFGLDQRYALDRTALDQRWRALQTEVHPDRFAAQGAAAQRVAMQWSVRVNEAYKRLQDPLQRAAYLCELRGVAIDAERNTAMPTAFLLQQMQWREALDDAVTEAAVLAIAAEVKAHEAELLADVALRLDANGSPAELGAAQSTQTAQTAEAAQLVRSLMFVRRFGQDIDKRLDALDLAAPAPTLQKQT